MTNFIGGVIVGLLIAIIHYISREKVHIVGSKVVGYFSPSGEVINLSDPLDEALK